MSLKQFGLYSDLWENLTQNRYSWHTTSHKELTIVESARIEKCEMKYAIRKDKAVSTEYGIIPRVPYMREKLLRIHKTTPWSSSQVTDKQKL